MTFAGGKYLTLRVGSTWAISGCRKPEYLWLLDGVDRGDLESALRQVLEERAVRIREQAALRSAMRPEPKAA